VVYGGFTSNVDMKSGAPAFGTPEYTRAALAGGQLARRHGLPYRSSNANAANLVDAQAAYESEMSLWGAVMGHASIVLHGAGWMEGGLTASFEKFVLDVELLQMMAETLRPIEVNEATLGFEAIREVEPGGHFFGAAHTLERYETAFYTPLVSTSSAPPTPSSATRPRSIRRWSRTGATTRPGRRAAPRPRPSAPTGSTSRSWPSTHRRRSTRRSKRNSKPSSPGARKKAPPRRRDR
jgi:trimethylamine--corrinoid protein Co-methyltransferase